MTSQPKKKSTRIRYTLTALLILMVIIPLSFSREEGGTKEPLLEQGEKKTSLPTEQHDIEGHLQRASDGVDEGYSVDYYGLTLSNGLYQLFEETTDTEAIFDVLVQEGIEDSYQWIYQGKTLEAWMKERENCKDTLKKLESLIKMGEELKYGEALYKEGTASGTKWAQEYYEEQVVYYGTLLDTYIVEGEFLAQRVHEDRVKYSEQEETLHSKLQEALSSLYAENAYKNEEILKALGFTTEIVGESLIIKTTKEALLTIDLPNKEHYFFDTPLKFASTIVAEDDNASS